MEDPGEEQFSALSGHERIAAHASVDAAVATRIAGEQFGPAARRAGQVTVSLDDEGNLIETSPDGARRQLAADGCDPGAA
ncbi:MAG: hypothetical protein ACRBI6_00145 [Acidimicrobiales bacterium]